MRDKTKTVSRPTVEQFTRRRDGGWLVNLEGPDAPSEFALEQPEVVIGSGADADIVVRDAAISRRHLKLRFESGRLRLEDLHSKNGSYLEGRAFGVIDAGFGEVFRIGSSSLKVIPADDAIDPGPSEATAFGGLVGVSLAMRKLYSMIEQVAASDSSVLIEGETGTGKELVAEAIHAHSLRRDKPFLIFDCGAIPEQLIESTLFGHVRGSFTGAVDSRDGVFKQGDEGAVFLDEIGEMKLALQPALLRVLDRGMIRKVGTSQYESVDVRVIAATHRDLSAAVDRGTFREDLYYRIAIIRIVVPPLRDRPEDIEPLTRAFLRKLGRPDLEPSRDDLEQMQQHRWPGNVRQLRNVVERAAVLSRGGRLALREALSSMPAREAAPARAADTTAPTDELRPYRDAKARALADFERTYLTRLVKQTDSVAAAADLASMDRKHLRVLLRRHQLID